MMKAISKMLVGMLGISFLAVAVSAQTKNPSGVWTAALERGGRTGVFTLNLQVSGNRVTGTLNDPSGQVLQIENGRLEENQLSFDVSAREHGGTKPIHFVGDVEEGVITLHNTSRGKEGRTITLHRTG
jgi:hypothetical protein